MEIVDIRYLGLADGYQTYTTAETSLISSQRVPTIFGAADDYVEYFIKDLGGTLIGQQYNAQKYKPDSNFTNQASSTTTALTLDPEGDAKANGIDRGSFTVKYNFFKSILGSNTGTRYWIKEISPSRTEIKVACQSLSNAALLNAFTAYNALISAADYYPDFLLNFGRDVQILAVNVVYVEETDGLAYLIVKLNNPLPDEYDLYTQFWFVQIVADSVEFQLRIDVQVEEVVETFKLRGPNYKVEINDQQGQTTPYYNYDTLFSTAVTSSYQQLQSWYEDKAISINVDYSDFSNFIHFSSAQERLLNFVYKLQLIEGYRADIAASTAIPNTPTTIIGNTVAALEQNIDNIINKFDPYEYYLYFTSASAAWPKESITAPYSLYSVTSSQALNWLGSVDTVPSSTQMSMLYSASLFDNLNKDNLEYTMPAYIRDDENNEPYMTFLNMIGQHFDNIWIYYKDVSNRYAADNNPDVGISIDLVGNALRNFGIKLYTNSNISDNIYYTLFGINETGSILPITSSAYATVSLNDSSLYPPLGSDYLSASIYIAPFGEEKINRYVTTFQTPASSITSSYGPLSPNQLEKEVYKRIYHNLPYLLKTKGTQRGVKALIACYGIPPSILAVNEFGGYDIYAQPGIQQIQNEKVFTGSLLQISSSLLSPYTTLQYYQNNIERGSIDVEVGFSPADSINAHITGTLGNFNIMQYIGDPNLQYSSSYLPLDNLSNTYFETYYGSRYNVWDFIRIIKYYNNSIFKMVRDFVPSRASLTTGVIVKSHILERNKYARHEPILERLELSQSIDTAFISGSNAPGISISTAYSSSIPTPLGIVPVGNVFAAEPYTGEYSGSFIEAATNYFPQVDVSSITAPWTSSIQGGNVAYITYPLNYLYQNVSGSTISTRFLNLDYSDGPVVPANYGLITQSINDGPISLTNPYAPYAELQDYNYYIARSIRPRYEGSKSTSLYYNIYTGPGTSSGWPGDSSYGLEPAIDRNSYKLGWVKTIPTQSLNFYDKTTINLKYLVDSELNTTELSANNDNVVEVQNTYKSGQPVKVSVTDLYNPSNQTTLDGIKTIYRGGYRFDPILYREANETLTFEFDLPISQSTAYIGVRARSFDFIRFTAQNYNSGLCVVLQEPSTGEVNNSNPGDYRYIRNGDVAINDRMSYYARYITQWQSRFGTTNPRLTFTLPPAAQQAGAAIQAGQVGFLFDNLKFTTVDINTETAPNAYNATTGVFRASRSSNNYKIRAQMPFFLVRQQTWDGRTTAFKVGLMVQKTNTPDDINSWQPIAVSALQPVDVSNVSYDTATNTIWVTDVTTAGSVFNNIIDASGIEILEGDYVRAQFYLIDISSIHGNFRTDYGSAYLDYIIGGGSEVYSETTRPFLEITDLNASYEEYFYEKSYNSPLPLFSTGSSSNTIIFSQAAATYIQSSSFTPSTSSLTPQYYTPVVDNFTIQPYDLIRLGNFKSLQSTYYTVVSASYTTRTPISLPGSINTYPVFGLFGTVLLSLTVFTYAYSAYIPGQFNVGDFITISNAPGNNGNWTVISTVPQPSTGQVYLGLFGGAGANAVSATPTFTFYNTVGPVTVTLDRDLQIPTGGNISANFAILRPKPDETSVIINHRKQPGIVAQSLLIPYDASEELLQNVGTIYESLNQDLS